MSVIMTIEEIKEKFPIGAKVLYYPLSGFQGEPTEHTIRSGPWALGHGELVVKISGKAGGYSLEHLKVI
jgi:hypothetical protein